jgi:hypothetical protein
MPPRSKKDNIDLNARGHEVVLSPDEEITDYTQRGEPSQAQRASEGYVTEPTVYPRPVPPRAACPHCGGIL